MLQQLLNELTLEESFYLYTTPESIRPPFLYNMVSEQFITVQRTEACTHINYHHNYTECTMEITQERNLKVLKGSLTGIYDTQFMDNVLRDFYLVKL